MFGDVQFVLAAVADELSTQHIVGFHKYVGQVPVDSGTFI